HLEVAAVLGVLEHLLELQALLGGVAGDPLIDVLAEDAVAVPGSVGLHLDALAGDARLLAVGAHPVVGDGGNRRITVRHGGLLDRSSCSGRPGTSNAPVGRSCSTDTT